MQDVKRSRRSFRAGAAVVSSAAALALACSPMAKAANTPVTFGQFSEADTPGSANEFTYTDNGPTGDAELTAVSVPVIFNYESLAGSLPADLRGAQTATLTLTSSTTTPVQTTTIFGEPAAYQEIGSTQTNAVLKITRDTAAAEGNGAMTNLLTMDFTSQLGGLLGLNVPAMQGSTSNGNAITYTSDFLNFSAVTGSDFNVAFSSWISTGDGTGLEQSLIALDKYFSTATAAAAGTFDTSVSTVSISFPEPGSGALAGIGAFGLLARRRRRAGC